MLPRPSRATRAGSGVPRTPTPSSQASVAGVLRGFRVEQPRQSSGAGDVLLHTRWFHAAVTDTTVLVIGGGFAGVACAQELAKHDVDVILLDKNNYHQFQPLLYQVATAQIAA